MIDFWGVGYEVAVRMGIEDAIRGAGYHVTAIRSVDRSGRTSASLRTGVFDRVTGGRFISIPRGDLARAIYATIEHDVETIFGDSITAIDQHGDGVRLSFAHAPDRDFDLVVGADGLHSNVRRLVFGPHSDFEHYLGCHVAACVVPEYRSRDELIYTTHNVPNRQIARFTLRDDRTLFFFVFRAPGTDIPHDHEARKAVLRREFSGAGWESPAMLAALDRADGLYFDVVSQVRMDRWSKDQTLLIGDAAACISLLGGEGTGLAMTEAYVLAGELQRAGDDWRRAFDVWETRLRPFVDGKQRGATRLLSFFAARTGFGLWLRSQAMRVMNIPPVATLFAGRSLRDDVQLPDYRM